MPEDVISGLEAAAALQWSGHLRFLVFVADSPAHGFTRGVGDDHPSGLCPGQERSLKSWLEQLAGRHHADLLFCRLSDSTDDMEEMFRGVYAGHGGRGFASLPLERGSAHFRDALLGTLSRTLLRLVAPDVEVPGLQTFDGTTLSSIIATCTSSLRETIAGLSATVSVSVNVGADGGDRAEEGDGAGSGPSEEGRPMTSVIASRSDVERLKAELESQDMEAVRLVLRLHLDGGRGLTAMAAATLLEAGITVEDLVAKGYPDKVVEAVRAAGAQMLRQV